MFDYKKLHKVLEKEFSYQEKLLGLLEEERIAIVKLNKDQLDDLSQNKAKILFDLEEIAKTRTDIFENIKISLQSEQELKFQDVIACCPVAEGRGKLKHLCDTLKVLSTKVNDLNKFNSQLIKSSLGLIASAVSIIRSTPESDLPVYNNAGSLNTGTDDPAFARKNSTLGEA